VLNGHDIGTTPLSSMVIADRDCRAVLDMVWHDELASVRVRFLLLPHHDHLDCEIGIEPKKEIRSIDIRLNCYPSFFTAAYHRDGARRIQTPGVLVTEGQRVTLPVRDHWWAVYYDDIFDVANGEGDGPCGLLFLPEEAGEISFDAGSYGVGTRIRYRPESRRIRLAFWDFTGKTNRAALARVRRGAEEVRNDLAALDFTPAPVKGASPAAMRAEISRAMASQRIRESLGPKAAAARAWLEKYGSMHDEKPVDNIEAEERLLESIDTYRDFVYEVKLIELLEKL
jgi:hypothetical protein